MQKADNEPINPTWKSLYKVGGACALIALGFYLSQIFILIFSDCDKFSLFSNLYRFNIMDRLGGWCISGIIPKIIKT